jgi:hypothetical protein
MPREAFEGYDEPVNIDLDAEEALKLILTAKREGEGETKTDR